LGEQCLKASLSIIEAIEEELEARLKDEGEV